MNRRAITLALAATLLLGATTTGTALAGGPERISDSYTETFFDDFIFELCGIETFTTLTERWTFKELADGSATFHNVRTFVPDDPRIPIERGAATSFIAPDGSRTVIGKPTLLIHRHGGGVRLIDAGRVELDSSGNVVRVSGQLTSYGAELAPYYCP